MTVLQKLLETNKKLERVGEDAVGVKHLIISAVGEIKDAFSLVQMDEENFDELIEACSLLAELKVKARGLIQTRKELSRGI